MSYFWFIAFLITLVFAIKWKISVLTLSACLIKKEIELSDTEIKECSEAVVKNVFKKD